MRKLTLDEYHKELKDQGVSSREHMAFVCVACGTIQSAQDFIDARAGKTFDEVERYLAFSCIGRFRKAGPPPASFGGGAASEGLGCNWTLGGLFKLHDVEVFVDNQSFPTFAPATREQAQRHEALWAAKKGTKTTP